MRMAMLVAVLLAAGVAAPARGQSVVVQGSAGPTLVDRGYSLAGGVGWSPWSRVTVSVSAERTHLVSTERSDDRSYTSRFRGGTLNLAAAELRVALFPPHRVTPYVLAGYAVGQSRPNVTAAFPDRITNNVRAVFAGGGVQVPVRQHLSLFADARLMLGDEASEVFAVWPLRAGASWRF